LLFVAGCQGGFFRGTDTIQTYDFRKGTDGIAMAFLEGLPSKQMYVGTQFSTGLKIKNMGAYDIQDRAEITISAPPGSFSYEKGDTQEFLLAGRSLYVAEGEEDVFMFPMRALCYPGYGGTRESTIVSNHTVKIKADACYYYETTANVDMCVDTRKHLREAHEMPVCIMQGIGLSGGQGGPVGVVGISPTVVPISDKEMTLQLSVSIKKLKGKGYNMYGPNAGCKDPKQLNEVEIDVQMGGQRLWCEPYQLKLIGDQAASTRCTAAIDPLLGAYTTPVSVNIKYYVQQTLVRDVVVQPPPTGINCAALKGGKTT
ncbi:hypothetical protein KY349_05705, partial [Candidatus Woesearchaeota archaeon]|nr:hypothetical protein [Candidatus Woesearchaeota archaeon]